MSNLVADIVSAVAEEAESDPVDLTPPLSAVVDPDALRAVLTEPHSVRRVRFSYLGLTVTVRADGDVTVRNPTADT